MDPEKQIKHPATPINIPWTHKIQPWLALALLIVPLAVLGVSCLWMDAFRVAIPVVKVHVGSEEMIILLGDDGYQGGNGADVMSGPKGDDHVTGGRTGWYSVNVWGWCIDTQCSRSRLVGKLGLEVMP